MFVRRFRLPFALLLAIASPIVAASAQSDSVPAVPKPASKWYERLSLRGYAQVRYNNLFSTNDDLACQQCDRSIGGAGGFFVRRARLVVSGDVHERVSVYIQPDLAQNSNATEFFLQMRDLYGDVWLDGAKTLRIRAGLSKVPWGWENLQSSSQRLPFDRSDPINSGVPGERDLGVSAMWTPSGAKGLFRVLSDSGLKGTGDYGVLALAVYNGQSANRAELNEGRHVAMRATYPFRVLGRQIVEVGAQFYGGQFAIPSSAVTDGVAGAGDHLDERWAVSAVLYPQPFGVQAEWTWGHGPRYDPATDAIGDATLEGGYVQVMARTRVGGTTLTPYVRAQTYDGGKKQELDARSYDVDEVEAGVEWQAVRALELTAAYMFSDRRFEDGAQPDNFQSGSMLRLQAQLNY